MLLYGWLRPDRRRRVVLIGATAHLLTGALWIASGVALDVSQRLQDLLGALRALPYELALAYVCYLMVRSVGKNHPLTERLLKTGIYVLPCLPLVLGVTTAIYFPQPAIEATTRGTVELLVPRTRNVVEIVYLVLITSVFVRETSRNSTVLLRVQNGSLTCAGIFLIAAIATNLPITAARILIPGVEVLSRVLTEFHRIQLASMALCGAGFLVGIVCYYSTEEREAMLQSCRAWIRLRHEIETAAYDVFGTGLGTSRSGARAAAYYYRSAAALGLDQRQREQGRLTIVLLALMLDARYKNLVSELDAAQHHLLGSPEFAALSLSRLGGRIRYDIRDDDLYKAVKPALRLAGETAPPTKPVLDPPDPIWQQLAAVFAADAGFLPRRTRAIILSGNSIHATAHVLTHHQDAKRVEKGLAY